MSTSKTGVPSRNNPARHSLWYGGVGHFLWVSGVCLLFVVLADRQSALAQQVWVRPYQDEEDLWESFREGEITFDQYLELLALFQAGADSVYQPISDLAELPGYSRADSAALGETGPRGEETRPSASGRIELRSGYLLPLHEQAGEEGYFVARWRDERLHAFCDARSTRGQPEGFRKRGFTVATTNQKMQLTVGNFEPRYGLGLVVGRRDRVLGRSEDTGLSGSIWQPTRGNFNGLHVQSALIRKLRVSVFASRIENDRYGEATAGSNVMVTPRTGRYELGLSGAAYRLSDKRQDNEFRRHGAGLSFSVGRKRRTLRGEAAVIDGGHAAAAARLEHPLPAGRVVLTLWTYDCGFILPSSGGPGHPEKQRIQVFTDGLDYVTRTAGEQGLHLDLRSHVRSRTDFESVLEIFNDRLARTRNVEGILALRAGVADQTSVRAYLRGRAERHDGAGEDRAYAGLSGRTAVHARQPITWRAEYGIITQDDEHHRSVRLEVRATAVLNSAVRLTPRVRYVDPDLSRAGDGYWYAYLTETISPWQGFDMDIVVAGRGSENSLRHSYADVRIRAVWRP